jgi:NAD+ kinase
MRFLIMPNITNPQAEACAEQMRQMICQAGHEALLHGEEDETWLQSADVAIVVGGDGTVLRAVRAIHPVDIPIWAVNYGHLGYLTDCEPYAAEEKLQRIFRKDFRQEKRVMLKGTLTSGTETTDFFALNEAVIYRSAFCHTLKMRLLVDGTPIIRVSGDGMLVSTPTGSTAYNLSAGGPILLPEAVQAVVTPICPHAALCAPLVVSGNETVTVEVSMAESRSVKESPQLVIDGISRLPLKNGDRVECTISSERVRFVRTDEQGFYGRLQTKLAQDY